MEANEALGPLSIVVIDVGNSTTRLARWVEGEVADVTPVATGSALPLAKALADVRGKCENKVRQAIVIASVVPATTVWLKTHIENELALRPFVIGENTPLPVETTLLEPGRVGVDRVCSAAAAFNRTGHACTVIDVGSAVTLDVIDDEGVFQGGAILPGLAMQARALTEFTAQLPLVSPAVPVSAVGKNTEDAIASGLIFGLAGAIRGVVERIAMETNRWPQTILTGGGAALLHDHLDFVDNWVPDLCLMGVGLAYMRRVAQNRGV